MTFKQIVPSLMLGLALVAWGAGRTGTVQAAEEPHAAVEHAEETGDDEHGGVNTDPLEFKTDLAIWTAVIFLVLLAVLWKFAWGPLAQGLEKREQGIADQIAQAGQSNREAKELLAQYEQKLVDSKEEVRGILDLARRDAEKVGQDMLEKAKAEAAAEQQRAVRQIDTATAMALKELADHSANLAVELAGKIVAAELKPGDHARLIQQTVTSFGRRPPSNN